MSKTRIATKSESLQWCNASVPERDRESMKLPDGAPMACRLIMNAVTGRPARNKDGSQQYCAPWLLGDVFTPPPASPPFAAPPLAKNPAAVALGRAGGKAGTGTNKARPSDQMRAAAAKRWARQLPIAVAAQQVNDASKELYVALLNDSTAQPKITEASKDLFLAYARDAHNWAGTPLIGGNVGGSKEDRGNLTQLKRAGLVSTFDNDGEQFIEFTPAGKTYAASFGIQLI